MNNWYMISLNGAICTLLLIVNFNAVTFFGKASRMFAIVGLVATAYIIIDVIVKKRKGH